MEVPFRAEFIMQHRNRRNFSVHKEGDTIGTFKLNTEY